VENFLKNSLTGLHNKQNAPLNDEDFGINFDNNIFNQKDFEKIVAQEDEKTCVVLQSQKRLNDFDANILRQSAFVQTPEKETSFKTPKELLAEEKEKLPVTFLHKFFPKVYQSCLIRRTVFKMNMLNKMATELGTKQIPYGEEDKRYDKLITYLNCTNTLNVRLKRKIKS
jgi:hypothetical protein